ncbi:carboxypeptidase regulatory-like domain-containing protein (plasmid) [Streptomyces sp. AHU1]|uniref:Kelch repeat-containing protein n=1 Tax=Streptomyces sp. AHU1 TaxID=3377215 RepID=UPI003877E906
MTYRRRPSTASMIVLGTALMAVLGIQAPARADITIKPAAPPTPGDLPGHVAPLCGPAKPHQLTCFGLRRTDITPRKGLRTADDAPQGFGPADLLNAYDLPADGGVGKTIAIVDAFDNPSAEADLAVYRAQYGLPPCTTANGCFTKVDQRGRTDYPASEPGWATEISLDLDMVSAVAPKARLLLVEADEASIEDLGSAVDQAVALGAGYVSNSYGSDYLYAPEDPAESAADVHYDHPGVAIVASSGDERYGVAYPAASPHVTAVGGTTLTKDSNVSRGWSESVWDHDGSGTGSGCSRYEPKPAFQKDTGCPGRTVADVSAVADPATGVAVYDSFGAAGGWAVAGGTSASAPIIAGVYANAGTPVAGTYPNAYPYAATALHDVATGSNGRCSPAYLCSAGPGYDGPTGLGTPDGVTAFRMGAHGTLTGTATDSVTGAPIAAAQVTAGIYTATTDRSGHYSLPLPVGTYDIKISAYGYASGRASEVDLTDGATVKRDFNLRRLATHSVSGTITDGSGHGWPLHAKIAVEGMPGGPVWSDAYTGAYTLDLPENGTYTLRVVSDDSHYQPLVRQVSVGAADQRVELALPADTWATDNPAYTLKVHPLDEQTFDSATGPPQGWHVTNAAGTTAGWTFDDPGARGNNTGGSGGFAIADNDHNGWDTALDTQLVSPVYDLRRDGDPELAFNTDYEGAGDQSGDVDVTADGGKTWTTVWHQDQLWTNGRVEIPLTAYAGKAAVQVRFHFTGPGMLWAVDDVTMDERVLTPVAGGMLVGAVTDANTGHGIIGAVVSTRPAGGPTALTEASAGDLQIGDGLYRLFVPGGGQHTFAATKPSYNPVSLTTTVRQDRNSIGTFVLKAARLSIRPAHIEATTTRHGRVTRTVTVRNTGTARTTVRIGERTGTAPGTDTPGTAWRELPDLPVAVMDNVVENHQGKLFSALGTTDGDTPIADLYIYDPSTASWSHGASAPEPRQATAHGFIGDHLYTVGGWAQDEAVSRTLQVYDAAHNAWTKGPDIPQGHYGASGAVLNGRLYVIGGCTNTDCTKNVYVFDPTSHTWSRAADYPQTISWTSCGVISGKLYCAGGTHDYVETGAAYVYNPASDSWQTIADMPTGLSTAVYASANGQLLISGGFKRVGVNSVLTGEGYAYDPDKNTWSALPDAPDAVYRGGGAPGLYRVGGSNQARFPIPVATTDLLPGYDQTESDVPWLSENRHQLVLQPGQSASFTVTMNASELSRSGTWTASLTVLHDTPYSVAALPVSLKVTPNTK